MGWLRKGWVLLSLSLLCASGLRAEDRGQRLAACTPTRLLVSFATLDFNWTYVAIGWPYLVQVYVYDDCANPLVDGAVVATFSNGDPVKILTSLKDGRFAGVWVPTRDVSQLIVRVRARSVGGLVGLEQISVLTRGMHLSQSGLTIQTTAQSPAPAVGTLRLFNLGPRASFAVSATTTSGGSWLTVSPTTGSIEEFEGPSDIAVRVDPAGLAVGDYYGLIRVDSPDAPNTPIYSTIVLNVAARGTTGSGTMQPSAPTPARADAGGTGGIPTSPAENCVATRLIPTVTVFNALEAVVSWPSPLQVDVFDDCKRPMPDTGTVRVEFSNGEIPFYLVPQGSGHWSGTWAPRRNGKSVVVTVKARFGAEAPLPLLEGMTEASTDVQPGPAPIVSSGGIVNAASYSQKGGRSPGEMVAIFGTNLASDAMAMSSLPLPRQVQDTTVAIGGRAIPLLYTSDQQVNAVLPFDLAPNQAYPLVVLRGTRVSVAQDLTIVSDDPGVFTINGAGTGQGHIYRARGSEPLVLASPSNPARAGDALVMYCAGLGTVEPAVVEGDAAPLDHLVWARGQVSVTIGGRDAPVLFAGLAPNFTGLYQVNVIVPDGVPRGPEIPVLITLRKNNDSVVAPDDPGPRVTVAIE